ncbi:MAG: CheR family methyltransferase [Bacteroidota bacterium]
MIKVSSEELRIIARYIHDLCGIILDESKAYLIESRLSPLMQELGCQNYQELYFKAKNDPSRLLPGRIIDAITTNETSFFRDRSPFELLKYKLVPDHVDRIQATGAPKSLSIWSAAASTGQEIYSIAITLSEIIPDLARWKIRLLGTDISDAAIAQASYGKYNRVEIERGLPPGHIQKYFNPQGNFWRIKDEIRAMASFQKMNLLDPVLAVGKWDIIFCRNVAIYFTPENRTKLFDRLANQLNPHGSLIIGSTESLLGVSTRYARQEYHNAVFYQLQ